MNRETESHFSMLPSVNIGRSNMNRPFSSWGSYNAGKLYPIYVDTDIMPGDSVKMRVSTVMRMMTPLVPIMDNIFADVTFFFVPHRLTWEHWENFWGQNDSAPWIQKVDYTVPQIKAPATTGWKEGSLADYLGYPLNAPEKEVDCFASRAYCKIWNDWWRDENWKNPVYFSTGDSTTTGTDPSEYSDLNPYDYVTDTETAAYPLPAAKPHDYFTSVCPSMQKGPDVYIPLGESAPIIGTNNVHDETILDESLVGKDLEMYRYDTGAGLYLYTTDATPDGLANQQAIGLAADLSNAVGATISQLRQSFAVQRFYEALARNGSRYSEVTKGIYGVTNPDFRLQRAEYLGGFRMPININSVIQSDAGVSDLTPLGHVGAMSHTADREDNVFSHAFTEHGTLMGLMVIRHDLSYSQGVNRMFTRKKIFDYYTPQLANLSEQAVLSQELYCDGTDDDETAWGYQECWAEYRYRPNENHGELRATAAQSLSVWNLQDYYTSRPEMGDEWIDATDTNIKRCLAVQDHDQFFGQFYFKPTYTRPMPIYSIPSLSSHF